MKAKEFDEKFDKNQEDIVENLDLVSASRIGTKKRKVNIDFPEWILEACDKEAVRRGVTRQSLIKMWVADKLDALFRERTTVH